MARPPSTHPTDGELELLQILWQAGPSSLGRICTALRLRRPIATTTVATMLKVMLDKGLIRRRHAAGLSLVGQDHPPNRRQRHDPQTGRSGLRRLGTTAGGPPVGIRGTQRARDRGNSNGSWTSGKKGAD